MEEFGLSLFQDGLLPAGFMVGLLISSPFFAEAAKHSGSFRLIGIGLSIWAISTLCSALSMGFTSLFLCRMIVGVGEASFVSLAAPFIDDSAPAEAKTRWLAAFYLCIPTGYALGFIYGGIVAASFGWRIVFVLESLAVLPFIFFSFRAPHINIRGSEINENHVSSPNFKSWTVEVTTDMRQLLKAPVYMCVCASMACSTAVLGSLSFYGPQAAKDVFQMPPRTIDISFGGITVATGVLGTLTGGLILDHVGSSLRNGLLLCSVALAAGAVFLIGAFSLAHTFGLFCVIFACGEFALFMSQAPSNAVMMWSVLPGLRPLAVSLSVVIMHLFGDVPAPPLLGALQSWLQDWRMSMVILSTVLALGASVYGVAVYAAKNAIDYRLLMSDVPAFEDAEGEPSLDSSPAEDGH
jgi:MFS family permease